jgi:hypothetical protein
MVKPLPSKQVSAGSIPVIRSVASGFRLRGFFNGGVMSEVESYCFDVQIFKNEHGKYEYAVSQEFETDDMSEPDWQLLESGEGDTLEEAAQMAGNSIRTLFNV